MTRNQVDFIKEFNRDKGDGTPAASSVHYLFHDQLTFRNENEFVFFDDDNELVHCISANADSTVKQGCPFSLISASYEFLMYAQANLTMDDLKYFLNNLLTGKLTDEQKEQITKWAKNLPVNPIGWNVSGYYKYPDNNLGDYNPITVDSTVRKLDDTHQLDNSYPVKDKTDIT